MKASAILCLCLAVSAANALGGTSSGLLQELLQLRCKTADEKRIEDLGGSTVLRNAVQKLLQSRCKTDEEKRHEGNARSPEIRNAGSRNNAAKRAKEENLSAKGFFMNMLISLGLNSDSSTAPDNNAANLGPVYAHCDVVPNSWYKGPHQVKGCVDLRQKTPDSPLELRVKLSGFKSEAGILHGFHVHELGNMHHGCASLGDHYNPFDVSHGGPFSNVRHQGDLGNIIVRGGGTVDLTVVDPVAKMSGPDSIMGRSLMIHENKDNGVSGKSAGERIGCCIIGYASEREWDEKIIVV